MGAGLMTALSARLDAPRFVGVGGSAMRAAGLECLARSEDLSVHGLLEPLLRLPALVRLSRRVRRRCLAEPVDAFVGVDFNVFNLRLERQLKKAGIPVAHYVSPSVYAWRRGRVQQLAACADLLLTLFPFEPAWYRDTDLAAVYIGHPLADEITPEAGGPAGREAARQRLNLAPDARVIALLPGSRKGEIKRHLPRMLAAALILQQRHPQTVFLLPCARPQLVAQAEAGIARWQQRQDQRQALPVQVLPTDGRLALTAADGALVKSGTGTLEAMLLRRPMVVTYRLDALTHFVARCLVRTPHVALPNLLAGRELAPECLQAEATPENLALKLLAELDKSGAASETMQTYATLHRSLAQGGDGRAAEAVIRLLEHKP